MLAATTAAIFVVVMMVVTVIVGMIMSMVMIAAFRVVVAATALVTLLLLVAGALPAGEEHEEKTGGEHENENDERIHSDGVTNRTLGRVEDIVERAPGSAGVPPASFRDTLNATPASETLALPEKPCRFSGVTTRAAPAIVSR